MRPDLKRDYQSRSGFLRWPLLLTLVLAVLAVSGCKTLSFYGQAIKGQCELFSHSEKVEQLVKDPNTPAPLRERFEVVNRLRAFAEDKLQLPVDGHYTKYADVHRPFVVWNVEAAGEFSMQPKTWWYPLVGSLEYRGYFAKPGAEDYGNWLQKRGYDVWVRGATAYSTLGWFKDPLLNTFIYQADPDLAETLFHELGHQRVFARGDTDFNEAFATTVGEEGARRWLKAKGNTTELTQYETDLRRNRQFVALVMKARGKLETLYGDQRDEDGKVTASKETSRLGQEHLRAEKARIIEELRRDFDNLKASWGGKTDYDGWFARQINNAQLNSVAAYYDLVPGFEKLLALAGGDLERFYSEADRLAHKSKKERQSWLRTLGQAHANEAGGPEPLPRVPNQAQLPKRPFGPASPRDSFVWR